MGEKMGDLKYAHVAQYVAKNRSAGREELEKFLSQKQLTKLDAEIAKAKDFFSQGAGPRE